MSNERLTVRKRATINRLREEFGGVREESLVVKEHSCRVREQSFRNVAERGENDHAELSKLWSSLELGTNIQEVTFIQNVYGMSIL